MAKEVMADANEELAKLIKEVLERLKSGDSLFADINFDSLFRLNKYHHFRESYRELLVKIVFLSDDNPIKKEAYSFIGKIIDATGEFDVSVILAMTYHKITPLTAELLCKYANELGTERMVGYIIYETMKTRLDEGVHHDVVKNVRSVLSSEEAEKIRNIVGVFRKFAK